MRILQNGFLLTMHIVYGIHKISNMRYKGRGTYERINVYLFKIGRHVKVTETGVHVHTKKRYTWIYDLNAPVVCGDVLKVKVKNGYDFMVVDKIAYIAGEKFCSAYKQAISHTGIRMEEQV